MSSTPLPARTIERPEPHWPASIAIGASIVLYAVLPERLTLGPPLLLPALELALFVPLASMVRHRSMDEPGWVRRSALAVIATASAANAASLALLVRSILRGTQTSGVDLFLTSASIWLTNVIVFALWFWELDRGGPVRRLEPSPPPPDFQFPQMENPDLAPPGWHPRFLDYVYVSYTNALAFSPTDVMPLSRWAKSLMLAESAVSAITILLVAARAVNIFG
jgi:uncharacterized membrane protein